MSVSPARMKSRRNADASAVSASAIGIAAATNVRKTTSSTMSAASRPSSSCGPCSIGGNSASPLYSAVDARRRDRGAHRVLDVEDRLAVLVVDHAVELRLGVRDPAVVGERVLAERVADALDPGVVLRRLELAASSASRSPSRSPPCARACRAAARRARRRRCSARRPARTRTRTRSGRSPSACPSPGSRTRPSGCRRPSRRGRSGRR